MLIFSPKSFLFSVSLTSPSVFSWNAALPHNLNRDALNLLLGLTKTFKVYHFEKTIIICVEIFDLTHHQNIWICNSYRILFSILMATVSGAELYCDGKLFGLRILPFSLKTSYDVYCYSFSFACFSSLQLKAGTISFYWIVSLLIE